MKVGFASTDWSLSVKDENGQPVMGGAGWARLGQYVEHLACGAILGVPIFYDGIFGVREWNGEMHLNCDVVVMQRAMFEDIPDRILEARANGQIIINDLDDWYWGLSPSNGAWAASHPKNNPGENINHYKRVLARSDYVTVSTPYLAERISKWVDCPIIVIQNYVDLSKFTVREPTDTDVPIVGWVGSTAHRSGDLELLIGILSAMEQSGKIRLHHSGHADHHPLFADVIKVDTQVVSTLPMVAPKDYPSLFTFDIGVAPLADVPFNRAKSAIKGLEYAASGIPFIASDSDSYRSINEDSGLGFIAKKPRHWIGIIEALRDPAYRAEQAKLVRERVEPYDIRYGIEAWDAFYSSIS